MQGLKQPPPYLSSCRQRTFAPAGLRVWPLPVCPRRLEATHSYRANLPVLRTPSDMSSRCCTPTMKTSCLGSSTAVEASQTAQPAQPAGLVFGLGALGSWDEAAVGSPVVRCYVGDDEQRWLMWYSGRKGDSPAAAGVDALAPSSGKIGVAISRDGVTWYRGDGSIEGARGPDAAVDVGAVMDPNQDWWTFDTCHLAPGDVQVLSNSSVSSGVGVYWMFYAGADYEPLTLPEGFPGSSSSSSGVGDQELIEGLRLRPGLAMSQDGRNWARIEADHHTGALFEVGDKTLLFNGSMQVLAVGPKDMRMYFTAWDTSRRRFVVALATSPDGFKWTQKGVAFDPAIMAGAAASDDEDDGSAAFDALGTAAVSVVRDVDNRQFLMFYEAVATDNRRSIGLAVSKDGKSWRRYPAPVLEAAVGLGDSTDPWDGGDVGRPCAVSMSAGRWRLYYCGRKQSDVGPWQGIGLALSAEDSPTFEGAPVQYRRRVAKAEGGASTATGA